VSYVRLVGNSTNWKTVMVMAADRDREEGGGGVTGNEITWMTRGTSGISLLFMLLFCLTLSL